MWKNWRHGAKSPTSAALRCHRSANARTSTARAQYRDILMSDSGSEVEQPVMCDAFTQAVSEMQQRLSATTYDR